VELVLKGNGRMPGLAQDNKRPSETDGLLDDIQQKINLRV
jgi:hypothetical protein